MDDKAVAVPVLFNYIINEVVSQENSIMSLTPSELLNVTHDNYMLCKDPIVVTLDYSKYDASTPADYKAVIDSRLIQIVQDNIDYSPEV